MLKYFKMFYWYCKYSNISNKNVDVVNIWDIVTDFLGKSGKKIQIIYIIAARSINEWDMICF